MNSEDKTPVMSFRLEKRLAGKLRAAAQRENTTITEIISVSVSKYIAELEKTGKRLRVIPSRKYTKAL